MRTEKTERNQRKEERKTRRNVSPLAFAILGDPNYKEKPYALSSIYINQCQSRT